LICFVYGCSGVRDTPLLWFGVSAERWSPWTRSDVCLYLCMCFSSFSFSALYRFAVRQPLFVFSMLELI
ncbi:MAG: hypothetical protein AAF223_12330, partial [Bacteroidota bacterium]